MAHLVRGAIHAVAPAEHPLYGRSLVASNEDELGAQLGEEARRLSTETGHDLRMLLAQVADEIEAALADTGALDRKELHAELRRRLDKRLLPWCRRCRSHHVPPLLWRYASIVAGARLDARRRYVPGQRRRAPARREAVRGFLAVYGPSTPPTFAAWAGLAGSHARRLWQEVAAELVEVRVERSRGWVLDRDLAAFDAQPSGAGIRLLPPGDPYLQPPNRPLLAPQPRVRRVLFRWAASPGVVLRHGKPAGTWRLRRSGRTAQVTVERLSRLSRRELDDEVQLVARLRGADEAKLVIT